MAQANAIKIGYIGNDLGYWKNIQERYKHFYPGLTFDFNLYNKFDPNKCYKLIPEIARASLNIIYLDYSHNIKPFLALAKQLRRLNSTKKACLVGLVELLDRDAVVVQGTLHGGQIHHIKNMEIHDVVFDAMVMVYGEMAHTPEFAMARMGHKGEAVQIEEYLRLNYMTDERIHIEAGIDFPINSNVVLNLSFDKHQIPSPVYTVEKKYTENHFYDYPYSFDMRFQLVGTEEIHKKEYAVMDDGTKIDLSKIPVAERKKYKNIVTDEEKVPIPKAEYDSMVKKVRKALRTWILDSQDRSMPKYTKVLIVDKALSSIDQANQNLGSYPFSVKIQSYFEEHDKEIALSLPTLIAYELEAATTSGVQQTNDWASFELLIKAIQKVKDYSPYLVIFNAQGTNSGEIQKKYGYSKIVVNAPSMLLETVISIAEIYEKKSKASSKAKTTAPTYYFKKDNELSFGTYPRDCNLFALSESELYIICKTPLTKGTVLTLTHPVRMMATVVGHKKDTPFAAEKNCYRTLIHSIDQEDKKKLRQYVNVIFCQELELARQKEVEEMEQAKKKFQLQAAAAASPEGAAAPTQDAAAKTENKEPEKLKKSS